MAYATTTDVRTMSERDIPATDDTRLTRYLDVASRRLDRLVPDLTARITSGELTSADVRDVVVQAVLRRWRNPEGFKGEHAGDYGYYYGGDETYRIDALGWFTDGEVSSLRASTSRAPRTIRVGTPFDGPTTVDAAWGY
jgi:hypothetical protein